MSVAARAAVLIDDRSGVRVAEVELDEPAPHEVIVRTEAVGLCHSDLHVIDGTLDRPKPLVLGHEACGVVERVGAAVSSVAPGDRVVTCLVVGCGSCRRCRMGEPAQCVDAGAVRRPAGAPPRLTLAGQACGQFTQIGALAERMLVDERALTPIPASVPSSRAALLGCAVVTGLGAVFKVAEVRPGDTVAVVGCGGVGLNVVQAARIAGAGRVVAVDLSAAKLALAARLGATDTVDGSSIADAIDAVTAITGGGADHVFEVVGSRATVAMALAMAAPGRRAYVLGILSDDAVLDVPATQLRRGKALVGVFMGAVDPRVDVPRYVALWEQGRLDLDEMVAKTITLDEAGEGFAALAAGSLARTVVTFA